MAEIDRKKLDAKIDELENRLAKLKAIREVLDDEQLRDDLLSLVESGTNGKATKRRYTKAKGTVFDKVSEFFEANGNSWSTLNEIAAGSKQKKPSVRQTVYTAHVDSFERQSEPGGGRESRFRLKTRSP